MADEQKTAVFNLNSIMLTVLLAVGGWIGVTVLKTSDAVIRLETLVLQFPSRIELETKLNEINAVMIRIQSRIQEQDAVLVLLKQQQEQNQLRKR